MRKSAIKDAYYEDGNGERHYTGRYCDIEIDGHDVLRAIGPEALGEFVRRGLYESDSELARTGLYEEDDELCVLSAAGNEIADHAGSWFGDELDAAVAGALRAFAREHGVPVA